MTFVNAPVDPVQLLNPGSHVSPTPTLLNQSFKESQLPPNHTDDGPHSSFSRLPPELWLTIFPHLSPASLQSTSLTSSLFRALSQPLLFSTLDISPFFLAYNTTKPILRPHKYLDRTRARIHTYTQPHIAPAVTHIWISPYARRGFPARNHRDDLDPALVIDAVIAALPLFPNLTALSWHCIDITPEWWNAISAIPLKRIWLNSCTIIPSPSLTPPPPIRTLTHIDFDHWAWEGKPTNHVSIHEERSAGIDTLLFLPLLLNPDLTQYISVPRLDTASSLLSSLAELPATLSLTSLTIPYSALYTPTFTRALVQCPALRELHILPPVDDSRIPRGTPLDATLPSTAIPHLEVYSGPHEHLTHFVSASRRLTKTSLYALTNPSPFKYASNPALLLPTLHALSASGSYDTLQDLEVNVLTVSVELMRSLKASFPNLRRLMVESQDSGGGEMSSNASSVVSLSRTLFASSGMMEITPSSPITVLYILLRTLSLPPHLHTLHLHTRLTSGNITTDLQKAEAGRFVEGLAREHEKLERIRIEYGVYWTGTVVAEWGRVRGNTDAEVQEDGEEDDTDDSGYFSSPAPSSPSSSPTIPPLSNLSIPVPLVTTTTTGDRRRPRTRTRTLPLPQPLPQPQPQPRAHTRIRTSYYSPPDSPSKKTITTTTPLTLGNLTFTEHRRTILFPHGSAWSSVGVGLSAAPGGGGGGIGGRMRSRGGGVLSALGFVWSGLGKIGRAVGRLVGVDDG